MIETNSICQNLNRYLEESLAELRIDGRRRTLITKKEDLEELSQQRKDEAVQIIQKIWHKRKVKQLIIQNPYLNYLSLIDKEDKHYLLSRIMFGKHVAELRSTSDHRIENPYIHRKAFYHRSDNLSGILLDNLIKKFDIDAEEKKDFIFIPVLFLENVRIEELKQRFFSDISIKIMKDQEQSIGLVVLPRWDEHNAKVVKTLRTAGVIASPWEIAINIHTPHDEATTPKKIILDDKLPKNPKELIESSIYSQLSGIASNPRGPTQKLAICLEKILKNVPANIKSEAMQRIACIVDMINTFYKHDYPKFAFSLYVVMHEISLCLLAQKEEDTSKHYDEFFNESQHTLESALSLDSSSIAQGTFIACPAMSGTNAYMLAMKLALNMRTLSGKPPSIMVFKPSYYEFDYLTQATHDLNADIMVLSAGPIVNPEGLTPGLDINKFVKRHVAEAKREKPLTLVVDATTALYKNMHLSPEVKQLINEGKLSIIIHESHQKFGMMHADQAQYGRMMALCSKEQFAAETVQEMQEKSKIDFANHVDLRIGAYINFTCGDTLEEIKEQHFSNGKLLRKILTPSSLVTKEIVAHEDMLSNLEELYFVTSKLKDLGEASRDIIDARDSFGHFGTTSSLIEKYQTRLSPDASDNLDCLIQIAQLHLSHQITTQDTVQLLMLVPKETKSLTLSQQIITLALANNVLRKLDKLNEVDLLSLLFALNSVMAQCDNLKGRQYYNCIAKYYFALRQKFIDTYQVKNSGEFFSVLQLLNEKPMTLTSKHLHQISNSETSRKIILNHHKHFSNSFLMALIDFSDYPFSEKQLVLMQTNKKFSASVEKTLEVTINILRSLENSNKYQDAVTHSKYYFIHSFEALTAFHEQTSAYANDEETLIKALNFAKNRYCKNILGRDRSITSQIVRNLLKGFINFIAGLSLGAAHYIHYKKTGHALFFANTNSQNKLENFHNKMTRKIKQLNITVDSSFSDSFKPS